MTDCGSVTVKLPSQGLELGPLKLLEEALEINPEDLKIVQCIGKGACGEVYAAEWSNVQVAVKMLRQADGTEEEARQQASQFKSELSILNRVRHPHVLRLYGGCLRDNCFQLVTALAQCSLHDLLYKQQYKNVFGPRPWGECALEIASGIAAGMAYLHSLKPKIIIHRDLKPGNILLDHQAKVVIADFGISRQRLELEGFRSRLGVVGTPNYMAPEVLQGSTQYDKSVDVYAFGLILWELHARSPPFYKVPMVQLAEHVARQGQRPPIPPHWPAELQTLIQACWATEPTTRPPFTSILQKLKIIPPVNDIVTTANQSNASCASSSCSPSCSLSASSLLCVASSSSSSSSFGSSSSSSSSTASSLVSPLKKRGVEITSHLPSKRLQVELSSSSLATSLSSSGSSSSFPTENKLPFIFDNQRWIEVCSAKLRNFVPREHAVGQIRESLFQQQHDDGAFRILRVEGSPGTGKTSIMSDLVRGAGYWDSLAGRPLQPDAIKYPWLEVCSFHMCMSEIDTDTLSVSHFVRHAASCFAHTLPLYRKLLDSSPKLLQLLEEDECDRRPQRSFIKAVLEPLREIQREVGSSQRCACWVIDSLDEALLASEMKIPDFLSARAVRKAWPRWLTLLCATRPLQGVQEQFGGSGMGAVLVGVSPFDEADVARYVEARLQGGSRQRELIAKAKGNFLVAYHLLLAMENDIKAQVPDDFTPKSLQCLYQDFFTEAFEESKIWPGCRSLLEVIVAAYSPGTRDIVFAALSLSESITSYELAERLGVLSQFLTPSAPGVSNPTIGLYHTSLCQWLGGSLSARWAVSRVEGHKKLAGLALAQCYEYSRNESKATVPDSEAFHQALASWLGYANNISLEAVRLSGVSVPLLTTMSESFVFDLFRHLQESLSSGAPISPFQGRGRPTERSVVAASGVMKFILGQSIEAQGMLLHQAARKGHILFLHYVLSDEGVGVKAAFPDGTGRVALHQAAMHNQYEVVRALVEDYQCVIDPADDHGATPLHYACQHGYKNLVGLLLLLKANPFVLDGKGTTVLHWSAGEGHSQVVELLLNHLESLPRRERANKSVGAFVTLLDSDGWSAFHHACGGGHLGVVQLLYERAKNGSYSNDYTECVQQPDRNGWTGLHHAANSGQKEVLRYLLACGCFGVHDRDKQGYSSLHHAAAENWVSALSLLLTLGARGDCCDERNNTALHIACREGHEGAVRVLLEHSPLAALNSELQTPLLAAVCAGRVQCVRVLAEHNSSLLLVRDHKGKLPVHWACRSGNYEVATVLLEASPSLDSPSGTSLPSLRDQQLAALDEDNRTVLHWAAFGGNPALVRHLLWDRAEPLATDSRTGMTPLHFAADRGFQELIPLLLTIAGDGAVEVDGPDCVGRTALHLAAKSGHAACCQLLLDLRADPSRLDNKGRTPLTFAVEHEHERVAEVLLGA